MRHFWITALERGIEGNKWFSLIDKVRSERTLGKAWEKVQTNAGACGVDQIIVEFFTKDSQSRLLAVKEQLTKDTCQPKPIRRVEILKSGSKEKRPLGIPTVADRVVQSAVKMVIEPIFECEFASGSYGFRPGRGCKDALREVERLLRPGGTGESPKRSKLLTGEPDAGKPHVRFGGRGGANQCAVPTPVFVIRLRETKCLRPLVSTETGAKTRPKSDREQS